MLSNEERLNNITNPTHGCRFTAGETSHLLENGSELASYNDNCGMNNGHRRNILKAFMAFAYNVVAEWCKRIFGRCFSHVCNVIKVTLLSNYANFLLVLVPFAFMPGPLDSWSPAVKDALNLIVGAPLATTLAFAIEQMSMSLKDSFGNLLMATSGNVVEIIIGIVALRDGYIQVVQSTILGSIFLNLLLVTGSSYFLGGIFNMRDQNGEGVEKSFASATAQTTRSFMTMSLASLAIPASLDVALSKVDSHDKEHSIVLLSRGTAVILLFLYCLYLLFQLRTHPDLFSTQMPYKEITNDRQVIYAYTAAFSAVFVAYMITIWASYIPFGGDAIRHATHISPNFLAVFSIPAVSHAAEHLTAINMAINNKMDLAMGIAAGSCIQVSLFTFPVLVILGWAVFGQEVTMRFGFFETMALGFAVLVAYTAQDGKSNYLHGAMSIGLYSIIALAICVSPSDALDKTTCIPGS